MPETLAKRPDFAAMVRAEVKRVLADPQFVKAPVQSKLLDFLAERTVGGGMAPNQFIVAVDGLGKSESYDLSSDSYPRVQISRLRKNLEAYYTRQQGGDGLCLFLRRGDYQLRLAPIDRAYPDLAGEANRAARSRASADPVSSEDPALAPLPADGAAGKAAPLPSSWKAAFAGGAIAAAIGAAVLFLAYGFRAVPHPEPTVSVRIEGSDIDKAEAATIERAVSRELANSFVSDVAPRGSPDNATYILDATVGARNGSAIVTLYDRSLRTLYTEAFTGAQNTADLVQHLRSEVVFLTSRDGPIARAERRSMGNKPNSAYECYLRTIDPNYEAQLIEQTTQCLSRFPDSHYRARWLSLQAFNLYQHEIAAGQPVSKSGPAWTALQGALDADPLEPFTNFVAAKVELAGDNCELAERFVTRALDPGVSYPALLVAATASASGCTPSAQFKPRVEELRALIRRTPTIDPFFQVNLMLSSIAVGQADDARLVAQAIVVGKSSPQARVAAGLISSSLLQQGFFAAHRAEVVRAVSLYVWSPRGRAVIVQKLGAAAPA